MFNLLTQNNTPIIGWCAQILGYIMRGLYIFLDNIGFANIGVAIILFTIIVKLLMFPLTLKQQKFSKVSSLMNPEIQAIQKKYKNKRDNESMMKMQEETNAVYAKYGTSPSGSCLQLLIQMPIIFSLYYVISSIPGYVPEVKAIYEPISEIIVENYDNFNYMEDIYEEYILEDDDRAPDYFDSLKSINLTFSKKDNNKIIDMLAKLPTSKWEDLNRFLEDGEKLISDINENVTDKEFNEYKEKLESEEEKKEFDEFVKSIRDGSKDEVESYNNAIKVIDANYDKIEEIYKFGPLNLSQTPMAVLGWALLLPILSALSQWLSSYLVQKAQSSSMADNPMNSTMKSMNIVMPIISAIFCLNVPAGLGLYWVLSALVQVVQQIFINMYFKKVDINDIIKKNVEKQKNKKPSMSSRLMEYANENAKNVENQKQNQNKISSRAKVNASEVRGNGNPKPGSMAAKANMVKEYNDKKKK